MNDKEKLKAIRTRLAFTADECAGSDLGRYGIYWRIQWTLWGWTW